EKGLHEMSVSELGLFGEVGTVSEQAKQESEVLKTESEKSKYQGDILIEEETQKPRKEDFSLIGIGSEKSKIQGESLIFSKDEKSENLAVKISENENIPRGTAQRYIAEIRKELKSKAPKASSPKEKKVESGKKTRKQMVEGKAKEFQKKYSKLSRNQKAESVNRLLNSLVNLRKRVSKLNDQISELGDK
ncbi:chromosome partitioning protein ParB, partial [Leptospira santarosai]|nr:chromosome partitioning protein ParB [Leptospira santarosai]